MKKEEEIHFCQYFWTYGTYQLKLKTFQLYKTEIYVALEPGVKVNINLYLVGRWCSDNQVVQKDHFYSSSEVFYFGHTLCTF